MSNIAVLGLGNFGTALARNWSAHGNTIRGWTVEEEVFNSIRLSNVNNKYLPGVKLPDFRVTMKLKEALDGAGVVALAVPSDVILDVVDSILPLLGERPILVDLAKGLAPGKILVSEAIGAKLKAAGRSNALAVMTGPTIAVEVAAGVLTTALVASESESVARRLADELSTPTFLVRYASDPLGVELWGAFKNVIALACGVSDGLWRVGGVGGDNLKAALFTIGFREACRVLVAFGAQPETAFTPAGVGDLFVTATSNHGRNRRTGELLGSGHKLAHVIDSAYMVSEGVRATRMFFARTRAEGIHAPFVELVSALLDGKLSARSCVQRMLEIDD